MGSENNSSLSGSILKRLSGSLIGMEIPFQLSLQLLIKTHRRSSWLLKHTHAALYITHLWQQLSLCSMGPNHRFHERCRATSTTALTIGQSFTQSTERLPLHSQEINSHSRQGGLSRPVSTERRPLCHLEGEMC